jgi:hypothetical protein
MDNPEKQATLDTQNTRRRKKQKQKTKTKTKTKKPCKHK